MIAITSRTLAGPLIRERQKNSRLCIFSIPMSITVKKNSFIFKLITNHGGSYAKSLNAKLLSTLISEVSKIGRCGILMIRCWTLESFAGRSTEFDFVAYYSREDKLHNRQTSNNMKFFTSTIFSVRVLF